MCYINIRSDKLTHQNPFRQRLHLGPVTPCLQTHWPVSRSHWVYSLASLQPHSMQPSGSPNPQWSACTNRQLQYQLYRVRCSAGHHAAVAALPLHAGQALALAREVVALPGALPVAGAGRAVLRSHRVAVEPVLAPLAAVTWVLRLLLIIQFVSDSDKLYILNNLWCCRDTAGRARTRGRTRRGPSRRCCRCTGTARSCRPVSRARRSIPGRTPRTGPPRSWADTRRTGPRRTRRTGRHTTPRS